MPVNRELKARVLEMLKPLGPVACHRLFGGAGLYRGARLFAILHNDRLFLRVDERSRDRFERRGMGPFVPYAGRPAASGYYEAPPDVLDSAATLREWAARAMDVAKGDKKESADEGEKQSC